MDDDGFLARTLSDILALHGYAPTTALTASTGLNAAQLIAPAVALVDLRLPDMDGLELVAKLHELSAQTQVVVLTGNASLDSAVAAMRESSIDYLVKPVNVETLLKAVAMAGDRWQRQQSEAALRDSEERYRLLFDLNPEPLLVVDRETDRFLAVSDVAVTRYGYSREEFLEMTLGMLRATAPEEVTAGVDDASGWDSIELHRTRDGRVFEADVTVHDLVFAGRGARLMVAADVSKQREAERALRARERQQAAVATLGQRALETNELTSLFDAAVALVGTTLGTEFSFVLEATPDRGPLMLRAGVGFPSGMVGKTTVPLGTESHAGFTLREKAPVVLTDARTEQRFTPSPLLHALGIVSGVVVPIPGPHRPFGVLGAHCRRRRTFGQDDIHFLQAVAHILGTAAERSATDRAYRQSQRLEAVGRLAGGVAHDFNNLLTAITGYSQLLLAELPEGNPMREDVDQISQAAGRAAALTRQLLAFSRQQVLQTKVVNLNAIVGDMERMLRRLIGDDVVLETVLHPGLGMTRADVGQLEQVIVNLVVNARDAMPSGGTVVLQTTNEELDDVYAAEHTAVQPGPYVMLSVNDAGSGMDRETQARIFEPFYTTKGPERGTGLGLATVYGIVKQSGGYIWVYSELGHGTTFKIYLPRVFESAVRSPVEDLPAVARRGSETILVVEDDETIRNLTHRILSQAGYHLLMARDGDDALRLSAKTPGQIHLLATDVVMPNMRGGELAARLATSRPHMRVLFLSGYTDTALVRQGLIQPGMLVLRKPFASDALLRKVREALDAPAVP